MEQKNTSTKIHEQSQDITLEEYAFKDLNNIENEEKEPEKISIQGFNPLDLRFKQLHHSGFEGLDSIRLQARHYEKVAQIELLKVKNRGKGDTAVNAINYASRELMNLSRKVIQKTLTPKLVYEWRYAKAEFDKAKKMSVAKATKLPYAFYKAELRKKREEEEDVVFHKLYDEKEEG